MGLRSPCLLMLLAPPSFTDVFPNTSLTELIMPWLLLLGGLRLTQQLVLPLQTSESFTCLQMRAGAYFCLRWMNLRRESIRVRKVMLTDLEMCQTEKAFSSIFLLSFLNGLFSHQISNKSRFCSPYAF